MGLIGDVVSTGVAAAQTGPGKAAITEGLYQLSPAARAQKKMFKAATERMRAGNYGYSQNQAAQEAAPANQQLAAQQAQASADIARAQAGGALSGGAATEAQAAASRAAAAGAADVAGQVQRASTVQAQQMYDSDQARIDAQAAQAAAMWRRIIGASGGTPMPQKGAVDQDDPNNPFNAQPDKSKLPATANSKTQGGNVSTSYYGAGVGGK